LCAQVKDEDDVYDEVSQKEYEKLVESRREMADFVVDDDGLYADNGEEDIWDDVGGSRKKRRKTGDP
jgi:hypothetical protein